MGEEGRIKLLETGLRETQDSILLMSRDIHSLTQSTQSIANSMSALVTLQKDVAVEAERAESRHNQLKEADKVVHKRVDELNIRVEHIEEKCETNTEELVKRNTLENRFIVVETNLKNLTKDLEVALVLVKYPKIALFTGLGMYIFAIKDIRDIILQSLGM